MNASHSPQKRGQISRSKILAAIVTLTSWKNRPPTIQEIGQHTGLANVTVAYHLQKLQEQGLVTWETGRPRTLRIVNKEV
jgi:repressor LexA